MRNSYHFVCNQTILEKKDTRKNLYILLVNFNKEYLISSIWLFLYIYLRTNNYVYKNYTNYLSRSIKSVFEIWIFLLKLDRLFWPLFWYSLISKERFLQVREEMLLGVVKKIPLFTYPTCPPTHQFLTCCNIILWSCLEQCQILLWLWRLGKQKISW